MDSEYKQLRYGLIGAGSAARLHLAGIAKQAGAVLSGIADPRPPTEWRIPSDYATVPHFTDAFSLLNKVQPQLVSICTPNKYHHELTLMALHAGAHVACEKPMAMTVSEAEEMENTRARMKKIGGVNFCHRNVPAFRFARDLIMRGELGRILRVNVVYLQSFVRDTSWSWRSDVNIAGFGSLGDLGVHMIDMVRFVTGLEFRRVVGVAQTLILEKSDRSGMRRRVTTDTSATFLAELSTGVIANFESTQVAPGYGDFFRLEISGDMGTVAANSEHPAGIWLRSGISMPAGDTLKTNLPFVTLPHDFIRSCPESSPGAIVHAIHGAQVEFPTFLDGLAAQRVLGALHASTTTGAWVELSNKEV